MKHALFIFLILPIASSDGQNGSMYDEPITTYRLLPESVRTARFSSSFKPQIPNCFAEQIQPAATRISRSPTAQIYSRVTDGGIAQSQCDGVYSGDNSHLPLTIRARSSELMAKHLN
jgi:hypothetical protein